VSNIENKGASGVLAFLVGAAAGAIVIALTTPKRGSEFRSELKASGFRAKRRITDLGDQIQDRFRGGSDRIEAARDDLKEGVSSAGRALREEMHHAGQDLRA
jgi:gas vesicle protein